MTLGKKQCFVLFTVLGIITLSLTGFILLSKKGLEQKFSADKETEFTSLFSRYRQSVLPLWQESSLPGGLSLERTIERPVTSKLIKKDFIKRHIQVLSEEIGVRRAGSKEEKLAAQYIKNILISYGYTPVEMRIDLPDGKVSFNIIAEKKGQLEQWFVVGAHYDSKHSSPGANDNATGVAALLELARVFKDQPTSATIFFAFFGAEEILSKNPDNHHLGSRQFVAKLSSEEISKTIGMISIDMIGYGHSFHVRNMSKGSRSLVNDLLTFAEQNNRSLTFLRDKGRSGQSDHEPFELAGIPAAWIEWRPDPFIHTAKDNYLHIDVQKVFVTTQFLLSFLKSKLVVTR
jgi:hypothetical protein